MSITRKPPEGEWIVVEDGVGRGRGGVRVRNNQADVATPAQPHAVGAPEREGGREVGREGERETLYIYVDNPARSEGAANCKCGNTYNRERARERVGWRKRESERESASEARE